MHPHLQKQLDSEKNNNYTSLDYFQKALIIQNKQGS